MPPVQNILTFRHDNPREPYPAPCCRAVGVANGSYAEAFSLWVVSGTLAEGAELAWNDNHGDEAIFVIHGALTNGEEECKDGDTVVIESGVRTQWRAAAATKVLHFGALNPEPPTMGPLGPPETDNHRVHVVTAETAQLMTVNGPDGAVYEQTFYADSTCRTCRLALFKVRTNQRTVAQPHRHSQDEIIHVLKGEMHVGTLAIESGMSIAIRGNARYGFTAPGPIEFLNYRADASYISINSKDPPVLETVSAKRIARAID